MEAEHLPELRALLEHPKAVAVGETGLDYFRDYAPHPAQQTLFESQLAIASETGKPVVIHTRAADDDTLARLVEHDGPVILHCFSSPALLEPALERGWFVSFAGNVTYKNAYELRASARARAGRAAARRDGQPLSRPAGRSRPPQRARLRRCTRCRALAQARAVEPDELAAQIDANAAAVFGL